MENDYFVVRKITCDPDKMSSKDGLQIVSFRLDVLDKYKDHPDYVINIPQNVGTLRSNKQGWLLQLDVHDHHVNTWLYKMGGIPEDEQAHFTKFNIFPKELSQVAHNRWTKGLAE